LHFHDDKQVVYEAPHVFAAAADLESSLDVPPRNADASQMLPPERTNEMLR
jgi:hypothetical protein